MASLEQHLANIKIPLAGEKVYKDECVYSCDTPECDTGLYICMKSFLGFGKKHVERQYKKTGNAVFLHMKRIKKEKPKTDHEPEKKKPTKMALGIDGGFDLDESRFYVEEEYSIVLLPEWTVVNLETPDVPEQMQLSATAIIAADSAAKADEAAAMTGTWEGEKRKISRHAENLDQMDNGVKIKPQGWQCSRCDKTDNLWLNLTDGAILCGRKFWDGSGGNNHAVDHYNETNHPLAVKLGTITPDGADVYSYDEDDMVEDPHLTKHLAHFGINIAALQKTDKTMVELEVDYNQRVGEWSLIQESGSALKPMYGPGYTGINNLGNSCYMNSVMQVLFTIKDFQDKYISGAEAIFNNAPSNCVENLNVQLSKFGSGLMSGDYSKQPAPMDENSTQDIVHYQNSLVPRMLRSLIGKGHPEFATKRQQDAQEYLLHVLQLIERNSRGSTNPGDSLRFTLEDRIQCVTSGKVKYVQREDLILPLPIPMTEITNQAEVDAYKVKKEAMKEKDEFIDPRDEVRSNVPFSTCINSFTAAETIVDFYSTALKCKTEAKRSTRFVTFPDYLFVQLRKFTIGDDWVPKKLDVNIDVPDELDLTQFRATGLQAGEELLPEDQPEAPQIDEGIVSQLVDMGFSREGCKKAVFHTGGTGVEPAMNWVMENMDKPDFNTPFVPPGAAKAAGFTPNEEAISMLSAMGFNREQAIKALKNTDNNLERAAEWMFSHSAELDAAEEDVAMDTTESNAPKTRDGGGKYRLVGFISHMGTSTLSGHYVCHIKKGDQWIIYNDEKVAVSENPPRGLGYLYLYARI